MVYVAALGHLFGPNAQRGVFRSTDGGKTRIGKTKGIFAPAPRERVPWPPSGTRRQMGVMTAHMTTIAGPQCMARRGSRVQARGRFTPYTSLPAVCLRNAVSTGADEISS